MPSFFLRTLLSIRSLILMLLLFTIAGCGSVDWFPEYVRLPTTPNEFSFASKTNVPPGSEVTSDPATVIGLTGDSSPISITGSPGSNSKYSINGTAATDVAGTVKNGDQVTVIHTSATGPASEAVSTLTIGTRSGTFTSRSRSVVTPIFSTPIQSGAFLQVSTTVSSFDNPLHTVSIKDSAGSANPEFAIVEPNNDSIVFGKLTQTNRALNGRQIYVRTIPVAGVTTILTIDTIDISLDLSHL